MLCRRLFCHVEGAAQHTGDAAPCFTNHSLRTGWTSDDDPRGQGFLPCSWGLEGPDATELFSGPGGRACAADGDVLAGGESCALEPTMARAHQTTGGSSALLAVCALPVGEGAHGAVNVAGAELDDDDRVGTLR